MTTARIFPVLALVLLCAGCASTSRYSMDQDAAPSHNVDVSRIPAIKPQPLKPGKAGNKSPYTVWGKTYHVLPTAKGYHARGLASWYGAKFHGHRTSDGEIFSMYRFTAAHRTLPLPCFVRVTNLENGRSLIVRVNDRGPFHSDRLIDLSYAAAKKLGFASQGTTRVEVDAVSFDGDHPATRVASTTESSGHDRGPGPQPASTAEGLYVQVAAFTSAEAARRMRDRLSRLVGKPVRIEVARDTGSVIHRVQVGPFGSHQAADAERVQLKRNGYDSPIVVSRPASGSG